MKKFLLTIIIILCSSACALAVSFDEDFEGYNALQKPQAPWSLAEKSETGGEISIVDDGNQKKSLKLKLTYSGGDVNDSFAYLSGSSNKFIISAKVRVTDSTKGYFTLVIRDDKENTAAHNITLFRMSNNSISCFNGAAMTQLPYNTASACNVTISVDRISDTVIVYIDGEEKTRVLGFIKTTNQDLFNFKKFDLRLYNSVNKTVGNVMETFVDDVIFYDNISEQDGLFCSPINYEITANNTTVAMPPLKTGEVKARMLAMNLLESSTSFSFVTAIYNGNALSNITASINANIGFNNKITAQTILTCENDIDADIKSFVFNSLDGLKPIIEVDCPIENQSQYPANEDGLYFLRNTFAAHEISGLLYYNNKKIVPEYYPFSENGEFYIHMSDIAEAFKMDIELENNIVKINTNIQMPLGIPSIIIDGISEPTVASPIIKDNECYLPFSVLREFLLNNQTYTAYKKLHVLGGQNGTDTILKDTASYMSFERPGIKKISQMINSNEHARPRILINQDDLNRIRSYYQNDEPLVKSTVDATITGINGFMNEPPIDYNIPDGLRLLDVSRAVQNRLEDLSIAYLITGNSIYAERAWVEIEHVCEYADWNAYSHFLDAGELMAAFAVAYDWLHDYLTDNQLAAMREAMMNNGIIPTYNVHHQIASGSSFWRTVNHNWNAVCNGGAIMAALAIIDDMEDKSICIDVIQNSIRSLEYMLPSFAPDGAWAEGPDYWKYTMRYISRMFSSLDATFGTDFGLSRVEGFSDTGAFIAHLHGFAGNASSYNFHDMWGGNINSSELFWLAKKNNDPSIGALRYKGIDLYGFKTELLDILWYLPEYENAVINIPLDQKYRDTELLSFRSSWSDKKGLYLAAHGGATNVNHYHIDGGSFVFDYKGIRWAEDLGVEDYNLDGMFDNKRNEYYRIRAESHNTIVINPSLDGGQRMDAFSPITDFETNGNSAYGVIDLTSCYSDNATSVKRGFGIFDNKTTATIRDEIVLKNSNNTVYWFMTTKTDITATVDTANQQFILTRGNETLYVKYSLNTVNFQVGIMNAEPLPTSPNPLGQKSNIGYQKLYIKVNNASGDLNITTKLTQNSNDTILQSALDSWTLY